MLNKSVFNQKQEKSQKNEESDSSDGIIPQN